MIIGEPFKVDHDSKKGYKWVITRICDKCGDKKDVQGVKEIIQRQERDGIILCNSCNQKQRNRNPSGTYKDQRCFKKDGVWLIERVCENCGNKQDISCSSFFYRRKNGSQILCWDCSQKDRKIPRGKDNGHWKHGITTNGYRRINIDGKRVLLHRYTAEQKIGRKLNPDEQVHHIDLDKLNNAPDNLYVYENRKQHQDAHMSLERCGFQLLGKSIWYDADLREYTLEEKTRVDVDIGIPQRHTYVKTDPRTGTAYEFWWDSAKKQARRWHIVVAEIALGRKLRRNEKVHHIDGNSLNNDHNNLSVMSNKKHKEAHWSLQRCVASLFRKGYVVFQKGRYSI